MVAFAVVIIFTAGSGQQGSWLFLNSTLPFVRTEGEPYSQYRAILKPACRAGAHQSAELCVAASLQEDAERGRRPDLGAEWHALTKNKALYKKVANRLAIEAVLAHPLEYAQIVLRKIALADKTCSPRNSPAEFWKGQQAANAERIKRQKRAPAGLWNAD